MVMRISVGMKKFLMTISIDECWDLAKFYITFLYTRVLKVWCNLQTYVILGFKERCTTLAIAILFWKRLFALASTTFVL